MSQQMRPLNGGIKDVVLTSAEPTGSYLSEQFTKVAKLTPEPTPWLSSGRPIYDRLPSVSQRYNLNFAFDDNTAYPYIPYGEGYTGPTSMAVQSSGDNKFLVIQAGNIVWRYGTIETDPVIIDLQQVGLGSAQYLLAYQLYYDDAPIEAQYEVEGMSLAGLGMVVESGTDIVSGWRYSPSYAFLGSDTLFWSNYDAMFSGYTGSPYLSWQLPLPAAFSRIILRCPKGQTPEGTATLSYMTCPTGVEDGHCKAPVWVYSQEADVSRDSEGSFFLFSEDLPQMQQGWRVDFSDAKVSISSVSVDGVITLSRPRETPTTNYALVAYPRNSVPSAFTNSLGEEVPLVLCKLAYVDIDDRYTVLDIRDIREVVYTEFQPIAEWLTRPWDNNLKNLYDEVSQYSRLWMSPTESLYQEYQKLRLSGITLSEDTCNY